MSKMQKLSEKNTHTHTLKHTRTHVQWVPYPKVNCVIK
jgi:hypothetical protein